jgi:hypothetical protein
MIWSRYVALLWDTLFSRRDLFIEDWRATEETGDWPLVAAGRLRFWDGSLLVFSEVLVERGVKLVKVRYSYHYQDSSDRMVFRYDNVSHHPEIDTHPHHKHVAGSTTSGEAIEAAPAPSMADVLREIERHLSG